MTLEHLVRVLGVAAFVAVLAAAVAEMWSWEGPGMAALFVVMLVLGALLGIFWGSDAR